MIKNTIFVLAASFFISSLALATPPNKIFTSFDKDRQELYITVEHPVTDRQEHFIKEVVVYVNGSELSKKTFEFQASKRDQTMPPTRASLKPGDSVRVVAVCNKSGQEETILKIE